MINGIKSDVFHVVFTIKNSRYDYQRIKRRRPIGYIASTFPLFDGKAEEMLVEELCNVASELNLELLSLNFCGDHVHGLICTESEFLPKLMLLWKGKTAFNFNRRVTLSIELTSFFNDIEKKQGLWAKSYYQKVLKNENELFNTINYITFNRAKHGLKPLSLKSAEKIASTINNNYY